MKLASFKASGNPTYGVITDDSVIDVGRRLKSRYPSLRAALAGNGLQNIANEAKAAKPDFKLDQVTWLPPIPDPDKIICIGLNYKAHAAEAGLKVPEKPSLFIRFTNTLVPHGDSMIRPKLSSDMDYEGELALIIGKGGRHIAEGDALKHVAGYSCFNDGSLRDYQFKHSLAVGKNFIATGGFGPWIVTTDEIPDPSKLTLRTRLNGIEVQHGTTDDLIFTIPWIIAYVSDFTELVPGDVIATGTPHGVGFARKPPLWMKPGDVVEVDISKIGVLRNNVVAEGN
jgi:2-keto-4-pentenoate hydratase/2-oxohepta-3-ene-1,7-dioic acid hydratase in catechol pathway